MRGSALLLSVLGLAALAGAEATSLIDFEIEDQFRRKHRDEDFRGHVVLVLAADRTGSEYCGHWGRGVRNSLDPHENDTVRFLSVAKVTGVPFFLKGTIRGKFPKDEDAWLLLDWKGRFHESYDLASDACHALVFDPAGSLVHRGAGQEPGPGEVEAVVEALRGALPERTNGE